MPYRSLQWWVALASVLLSGAVVVGCSGVSEGPGPSGEQNPPPAGFPEMIVPTNNPTTSAKALLGRHLFYDKRFSRDFSTSCGSCHLQEHAFSDTVPFSRGVEGRSGTRNAPSLANVGYNTSLLWEGGVPTLEQQAIVPITHPDEMDLHTDTLIARLKLEPIYASLFIDAWGDDAITIERITKSLAAFQRGLISGNSAFDRSRNGDQSSLSASAKRGEELFFNEVGDCFHCHGGYNFTDNDFHNNGLSATGDEGRFAITQRERDKGKFKTPTLRNVAVTAPYMHDGRFATLEEVLNHYNAGGQGHANSDALMRPLNLTDQEKQDLIEFLRGLTDEQFLNDSTLSNPWQ